MTENPLLTTLLLPLESAINHLLANDPATSQSLGQISSRYIEIHASDLAQSVFIIPYPGGIQLLGSHPTPDVCLHGTSTQLLEMATSQDKAQHLFGNGINIQGDTQLANRFQQLLANARIDWEALLADSLGDLPAHQLAQLIRSQQSQLLRTGTSISNNLNDYLKEELRLIPTPAENRLQKAAISQLREQTDRLSARIHTLQTHLTTNKS